MYNVSQPAAMRAGMNRDVVPGGVIECAISSAHETPFNTIRARIMSVAGNYRLVWKPKRRTKSGPKNRGRRPTVDMGFLRRGQRDPLHQLRFWGTLYAPRQGPERRKRIFGHDIALGMHVTGTYFVSFTEQTCIYK